MFLDERVDSFNLNHEPIVNENISIVISEWKAVLIKNLQWDLGINYDPELSSSVYKRSFVNFFKMTVLQIAMNFEACLSNNVA